NALHQHKEQTVVRDGMDIALCNINLAEKKVEYAGAHNSLYICRNGEKNHEDIEIIKADRLGIGGEQMEEGRKFTNNTIELNQGDTTYMFSDGFPDQFGGPKNKKFGPRRFRELLLNIQEKAMKEQEGILDDAIVKWMGNYEQTDDILVIGVRV
ncbi:MAG: SpoIIE family protein phosphatase, partial [Bacteroidia bacterium]|nr:SpoIIE family protein phosphatase [Bacteroidia bacterium]